MTHSSTTYRMMALPALQLLGLTGRAETVADVPDVVGPLFGELLEEVGRLGLDVDQPALAWYGGTGQSTELGVGLPADQVPVEVRDLARLQPTQLEAVEAAVVTRYVGPLEGMAAAWSALHDHLAERGLRATVPCREIYLQGSIHRPDPWIVELQQPVVAHPGHPLPG